MTAMWPNKSPEPTAGWRCQFRFAVHGFWPGVAQLSTLGHFAFMEKEFVIYKGIRMIKGWPEKIEAAQLEPKMIIGGIERQRIRYGDEADDWGADRQPCHDCAVLKGQFHVPGCDVERCPVCGGQMITCECDD